ncbi:MAG: methyltransferase domain-containing protein [Polyangiales bacterium]
MSEAPSQSTGAKCRFCSTPLHFTFVDLGMSPLCQTVIREEQRNQMEPFYPLHVYVCDECYLVQIEEYVKPADIFTEYAYFSAFSDSWLDHASRYVDMISERLGLDESSSVVELASNDGYLLQYFVKKGIPALGIEPAANVAKAAEERGVKTIVEFFGADLANRLVSEGKSANLILGNNVLAQVPDINSFVEGIKILLAPGGVVTIEWPHLLRLMNENQFDTIYHEHFSYFSFATTARIFEAHGMRLFDVDELSTHGGSLRIYGCHADDETKPLSDGAKEMLEREAAAGLGGLEAYRQFREQVEATKRDLLEFLIEKRREGKSIIGYGAPGKGNTLLNYCGIRTDFLEYTVDRNPYKQGTYLPGTHVPVHKPERIAETKPDYILILPWNLKDEIAAQLAYTAEWGCKLVVPIPRVQVL